MSNTAFKFLCEEEFDILSGKERTAYLVRAHQEIAERQRILRVQTRRTVALLDQDPTIPVRAEPEEGEKRGRSEQ